MKTVRRILCIFMVSVSFIGGWWAISPMAFAVEHTAIRLAVIGFEKKGEELPIPDLDQIINEWLIAFLVNTTGFNVIERHAIEKVLQEQSLGQSGVIDSETAADVGDILGVNILVTGTLMSLGDKLEVTARLIDTTNGAIVGVASVTTDKQSELQPEIQRLAKMISDKLSPTSGEDVPTLIETFNDGNVWTERFEVWFDEEIADTDKKQTVFSQENGMLRISGTYRKNDDARSLWIGPAQEGIYHSIEINMRVQSVQGAADVCVGMDWNDEEHWTGLCASFEKDDRTLVVSLDDTESTFDFDVRPGQWSVLRIDYQDEMFRYFWNDHLIKNLTPPSPLSPSERLTVGIVLSLEETKTMMIEIDEISLR